MQEDKYDIADFAARPLGMRLAMVVRMWRALVDDALVFTDLTQCSWTVLVHVSAEKKTVSDLAKARGIELPPLTRTLAVLEKQGYIQRTTDDKDRRIKYVSLLPEGEKILKIVSETIDSCQQQIASDISPDTLAQFGEVVNQLAANISKIR